jgi:tetratricopeptide (TPR) repeat protein
MDQTEKRWFEKELDGNESLRKEVVLRRKVDNMMVNHDILSLRSKLADLERTRKEKAVSDNASRRTMPIRYAAMVAGLMMIGTLLTLSLQNKSAEELFAGYYKPIVIETSARNASVQENEILLQKAEELYNSNNYSAAADCFRKFLENNPRRMDAHLYMGLSEMGNENYPSANSEFKTVLEGKANLFQDKARWYLSLSLLKTNDSDEAKLQLEAIANSDKSIYRKEARKILRKL